ncbi:MAG: ABC transporter ATP-binding protein/permease [Oscillospiraceae bacterium]|nr:ABC transporter ATP-binding protein/permease [Oscillospiraceae bacterium]
MKKNILKWLCAVIGRHGIKIVLLCMIQGLLGGSGVVYALLLKKGIDFAAAKDKNGFLIALLEVIALVLFQISLRAVSRWLEELSRSSIENKLKEQLFHVLLKKDYASVTEIHSAEWLNRLTSDTVVTADGAVGILPGLTGMTLKMLFAFVVLIRFEYRFLYVLIPGGILLILMTYSFRKTLKQMHKTIQETDGKVRIFMQEHIGSLMIVKSFSTEEKTITSARKRMAEHQSTRMLRNRFSNICNIGFAIAMNGMYLLGFAYCGFGIADGTISFGTLTAVLQLISQIQSPFANITGYLPKFYAMTASAERLREAELYTDDYTGDVADIEEVHRVYQNLSAIRFENVSFSYHADEDEKRIRNVDFTVSKGDYIAFTGHSGCGKSTVLKLMMSLYHCDSGSIYLQMQDASVLPMSGQWHRLFAYVPQGNQLMSGSIRDIVSFSDEHADENRIRKALEISCADAFIAELSEGLDTILGERGTGLSEGQMQRIAIARAIYADAPVLLLDESTSALDAHTERQVLENIRSMTDKTVVIVTHRPAALEICNKILEFFEHGTELLSK